MNKKTPQAKKITRKSATKVAKKFSLKKAPNSLKKPSRKSSTKIEQRLLELPHSSISRISKSLEKIENFSSDLAEKSGITGVLGRAVLLRAKAIRLSLDTKKSLKKVRAKTGKKRGAK